MANAKYQKPKGTADILPEQAQRWQMIERIAGHLFEDYGYGEIRTPIFENYDIFSRAAGETSDVVQKEMYDFYDKGERHLALRPEGTAGVVRAFVENKLFGPEFDKPYKVYYRGPMFRYERPQAGRQRQFHQLGIEAFGVDSPILDAEVITMAVQFLNSLNLKDIKIKINSLGDQESRQAYHEALVNFLMPLKEQLSEDSQQRLSKNPLRILDSKDETDQRLVQDAPKLSDYLNEPSTNRFNQVQAELKRANIAYELDDQLVRGLDYYNHTIFELQTTDPILGSQATLIGGGVYSGLVEEFGGPETPAIGFAVGMERLIELMNQNEVDFGKETDIYVVNLGEHQDIVSDIVNHIRQQEAMGSAIYTVQRDYQQRSAKAQLKTADRLDASYVLVVGDEEVANQEVKIKKMSNGFEKNVPLSAVLEDLTAILWQDPDFDGED